MSILEFRTLTQASGICVYLLFIFRFYWHRFSGHVIATRSGVTFYDILVVSQLLRHHYCSFRKHWQQNELNTCLSNLSLTHFAVRLG